MRRTTGPDEAKAEGPRRGPITVVGTSVRRGWMGPAGCEFEGTSRNQGDPPFSDGDRRRRKGGGLCPQPC
jgi:hypothetical protein